MTPPLTVLDAIDDQHLFQPWFRDRETWIAWYAFLAALFSLPMDAEQLRIYQQCTGRTAPPATPAKEGWLICGRRAGKSFMLALVAVFLACFGDYRKYLAPGERASVLVIATDRKQARIILRYIGALLQVPLLRQLVVRETADGYDLDNDVTIEVHTASYRTVRGYAVVAALLDELAYWPTDDAAEPDYEVINALRPGMAQFPRALLLAASSPYARKGALWSAHRKHFGKDGDPVLVWQAPTRTMNPTIPQSVIEEAVERDPAFAQAEYLAQFRSDIESFINREVVESAVPLGLFERPPQRNLNYVGFVDPSGGSSDAFALAVAHRDGDQTLLDLVREIVPPLSPEAAIAEFAATLKSYNISRVVGDRYAGEFPREQFRKHGIAYEVSQKTKSDIYRDALPLLNSRMVELLDNQRLINQLVSLERRTARGGRDSIDHPPAQHDDLCNAAAGAVTLASTPRQRIRGIMTDGLGGPPMPLELRSVKREIEPEHIRVRWVRVKESDAPAARGP